jgi:hypothetical protein
MLEHSSPSRPRTLVALWVGGLPVVVAGLMNNWPPPVAGWTNWGIILLNAVSASTRTWATVRWRRDGSRWALTSRSR